MFRACSVALHVYCRGYIENLDGLRIPFVFRIFVLLLTNVLRLGGFDCKCFGRTTDMFGIVWF